MNRFFIFLVLFFSICEIASAGPGKLLLIGGGSEKSNDNSWNHAAYTWAVDQSANKRVAIIAFGESDSWLPDYFMNNCGADHAQNFNISDATTANAQQTYDDLITYDVIFLKGGDQFNYYSTYKGTKTHEAIEKVYSSGGVICGTSAGLAVLSEVVFTAQNGSAYPDECLKDPQNSYIQLNNDFFDFFQGYVFDTHFTIRARFGRLLGFMANWKFNQNEDIVGLGVDEMTAMSIDENGIGTVYGIGTVNIYKAYNNNTFSQNQTKLIADSVYVHQLLQGCTIDFNTFEIKGFSSESKPTIYEENTSCTIYASGSDIVSRNIDLLTEFANETNLSDEILIITGNDLTKAQSIENELNTIGANNISIAQALSTTIDDNSIRENIDNATKILFVDNIYDDLFYFIKNGAAGNALKNKLLENYLKVAFIGDNSRFIGNKVVENYLESDAAYYGDLTIKDGLGLLESTIIIPNTYLNSDNYEATNAAIPYTMAQHPIRFGIWLNKNNYIKYAPTNESETHVNARGTSPVIILKNNGTKTGISVQSARGESGDAIPQFGGFKQMTLSLIDESTPYQVGSSVILSNNTIIKNNKDIDILQNNRIIKTSWKNTTYKVKVFDLTGKEVFRDNANGQSEFNLHIIYSGIYVLALQSVNDEAYYTEKIFIK